MLGDILRDWYWNDIQVDTRQRSFQIKPSQLADTNLIQNTKSSVIPEPNSSIYPRTRPRPSAQESLSTASSQ
jgi:hypothetical protein